MSGAAMYECIDTGYEQLIVERQPRVLAVVKEAGVTHVLKRALEPKHSLTCESRAVAALQRIASGERFELILCELHLAGMSGLEFLGALEAMSAEHKDRTVLLAPGSVDDASAAAARTAGVPLLEQPLDLRYLQLLAGWYAA